jgi:WD40 repeat protein
MLSCVHLTGWVTQTFFIDCLKPGSCLESNSQTRENNQHCPNYLLSGSEDGTIKLWDLNNKGVIRLNLEQDAGISCMLLSKLKGKIQ